MQLDNSKLQTTPLPRVAGFFNDCEKVEAIVKSLAYLSLCYPSREVGEAMQMAYIENMQDLPEKSLAMAFTLAARECEFFPTPSQLLRLAGVETSAQCSEREARESLQWVVWRLRRHGLDGRAAIVNGEWVNCPPTPEPIRKTLDELGAGDAKAGARLIAGHPILEKGPEEEYPTLGLKLAAIEKLEARWVEAWRKVNR